MDTRCKVIQLFSRHLHTRSVDGPSNILKKKISLIEKQRKKKSIKKNQLFVEVPESKSYLDTASLPMILTAVGGALFAKLLMMVCVYDQEMLLTYNERQSFDNFLFWFIIYMFFCSMMIRDRKR